MDWPNLQTDRLLLEKLSLSHLDGLYEVYADEDTTRHVPRTRHESKAETEAMLQRIIQSCAEGKSLVWSVIHKPDGRVIGNAGLYQHHPVNRSASLGAVIHKDYWGRGIVVEALRQLIDFGFHSLNLVRIEASFETGNLASLRVVEKLGMTYEGTLRKNVVIKGEHRDSRVYSILREEYLPEG